ncbi:MAG: GNAT family N-acetyltransferase [Frankia sp.]|nr:GNAT family N-acetyltransferase [Frankia sp.]
MTTHDPDTPGRPTAGGLAWRVATLADVPAVLALVESAYRGESSQAGWTTEADILDGQRTDAAAIEEIVRGQDSLVLVVDDAAPGAGVAACCQLERRGSACYFGMFAVRPTGQARGLGSALLAEAERYARERWGATRMEMYVISLRSDLIAWYERRGYHRTGETAPFPYGDERFGLPRRDDLEFAVLAKPLVAE